MQNAAKRPQSVAERRKRTPERGTAPQTARTASPSAEHERAVGYEDPDAGQLVWFTLTKGPVHYVPDIDLYFKMFPVGDGSGGH